MFGKRVSSTYSDIHCALIHLKLALSIENSFHLQQADNFTNSLGVLQQFAVPAHFLGLGNKQPQQQQTEGKVICSFASNFISVLHLLNSAGASLTMLI
jgi:hypothetical protein